MIRCILQREEKNRYMSFSPSFLGRVSLAIAFRFNNLSSISSPSRGIARDQAQRTWAGSKRSATQTQNDRERIWRHLLCCPTGRIGWKRPRRRYYPQKFNVIAAGAKLRQ